MILATSKAPQDKVVQRKALFLSVKNNPLAILINVKLGLFFPAESMSVFKRSKVEFAPAQGPKYFWTARPLSKGKKQSLLTLEHVALNTLNGRGSWIDRIFPVQWQADLLSILLGLCPWSHIFC